MFVPKLYYFYWRDRGGRVRWLLEELNVKYTAQLLDFSKGEHESNWYLKINPNSRVPALVDGTNILLETGAIFCHLVDKFPEAELAPLSGSSLRNEFYKWVFYAAATLEPYVRQIEVLGRVENDEFVASQMEIIIADFNEIKNSLLLALKGNDYLIGGKFSAADIMVGEALRYCKNAKLFDESDADLNTYLRRLWNRPAFEKVRSIGPDRLGG